MLLFIPSGIKAQDTIQIFLDANFNTSDSINARYKRTATVKYDRYCITTLTLDEQIIHYGEYISLDPWIEDGITKHYSEPNILYSEGKYSNGKLVGKWVYYNTLCPTDTVDYSNIRLLNKNCKTDKKASRSTKEDKQIIDSIKLYLSKNIHIPSRSISKASLFSIQIKSEIDSLGIIQCIELKDNEDDDFKLEMARLLSNYNHQLPLHNSHILNFEYIQDESKYVVVEEMPRFQNGSIDNFRKYILRNLKYPDCAVNKKQGGNVFVNFTVEKNGSVSSVNIVKGIDKCLDDEAIRVVKSSPKWTPGKHKDQLIRVQFTIPIVFINQN